MDNVFDHLVIGLLQYSQRRLEAKSQYPYPTSLQHAINHLSFQFLASNQEYPKSFDQVLAMFESDITEWWPEALTLPEDMKYARLMYDGVVTQDVDDYINSNKTLLANMGANPAQLQGELDQKAVAEMVNIGRRDPKRFQDNYVFARRFLIEKPVAEDIDFDVAYDSLYHEFYELLRDAYTKINNNEFVIYEHQDQLWKCSNCGSLLTWNDDQPYCMRHDLCARITKRYTKPKPQSFHPSNELHLLKPSIHRRTCVPGLPEVDLGREIANLIGESNVVFWPGIDLYDLLIHIPNSSKSIAIDLKDYGHPHPLVQKLRKDLAEPLSVKDDTQWGWDDFYFVVPDFRIDWDRNYLSEVQNLYKDRPVVSVSYMIEIIKNHID